MIGLVRQELWRLTTRVRLPLLFVVMTAAGLVTMWSSRGGIAVGPEGSAQMTGSMMLLSNLSNVGFYFCLWPIVFGGTLAEDLANNYSAVLIVRAGSRSTWLASKVIAALVLSTVMLLTVGVIWAVAAPLMAPWDTNGAPIVVTMADALAERQPLLLAFYVLLVLGVAGAAVSVFSHLFGALVRSTFASQVIASVAYLVATLVLPPAINPGLMASALSAHAAWATPTRVVAYWVAMLVVLSLLVYAAVRTKEVR